MRAPLFLLLLACGLTSAALGAAADGGPHVRVRGGSRIEAQGVRAGTDVMRLRGQVRDDLGGPLAAAPVSVRIAAASAPSRPVIPPSVARCDLSNDAQPEVDADGTVRSATDESGAFCFLLPMPVGRYVVEMRYPGGTWLDGAAASVPVDLTRSACWLGFEPEPRVLSLDRDDESPVIATASVDVDQRSTAGVGLALTLSSERGPIGRSTTDADGRARFPLPRAALGPPGEGELRLAFQGNAEVAPASKVIAVQRRARVTLNLVGWRGGAVPAGALEEGLPIVVDARAAGAEVASGSVEARVHGDVVGAAAVEHGRARILVRWSAEEASEGDDVEVVLRYVPSAPWLEPGAMESLRLSIREDAPWRRAPLVLAGLGLAVWFVASRAHRVRALARGPTRAARAGAGARGEAKIDVLRLARDPSEGWTGRVVDADDGSAVAGAIVRAERPAFGRAEVLASVTADADGRFALPAMATRPADELSVHAPLHVGTGRQLPSPGEIEVRLVLRRRALVTRLVVWAKQRGRLFDGRPEPTPGQVRRAAGEDFRLARWADAVERAAYGKEPVDARLEADVERFAPTASVVLGPPADDRALRNPTKPNA